METIESNVLVVGGGGAGMSAASTAASHGLSVVIVDDNPDFGGQIWRKSIDSRHGFQARKLIGSLKEASVTFLPSTSVFDTAEDGALYAISGGNRIKLRFEKLIIASGARERFLPFRGWTLPNVYGAGGLQALVKGGMPIKRKRVVIAGTGPLLLAVADYLKTKGAEVLFVAEQANYAKLLRFGCSLYRFPQKAFQAAALRLKPGSVKLLTDSYVVSANGKDNLSSVTISRGGKTTEIECDLLGIGFHLVPNLELASLLDLEMDSAGVWIDEFQQTSKKDVYAVGETTGIGGIELACTEGEIAGHASAGQESEIKALLKSRKTHEKFAALLNKTYRLRNELKQVSDDQTFVCRCEDVKRGQLKDFETWRDAKLQTRCGMGPCQGRICGPAAEYLFGWKIDKAKPPIFPVRLRNLGEKSE